MLENYEIIAPNRRPYAVATTWNEACDKAVDLSLKWGVLFRVRRTQEAQGPFQKERLAVLNRSMEYIELKRKYPQSDATDLAKKRFEWAKHKLDTLLTITEEFKGTDFSDRHSLSYPVKAFRTDI